MDGNAIVIDTDGCVSYFTLPETDTLAATRRAVRGDRVDVVQLTAELDMWIDDEGVYNHDVNRLATKLAEHYGLVWQDYYGPLLLCSTTPEGATVGLSPYRIGMLTTFLHTLREA